MRLRILAPAISFVAVGSLALGACGSSSKTSSSTSTTSNAGSSSTSGGKTSGGAFCQSLTTLLNSAVTVAGDTQLADVKRDFPKVVSAGKALTSVPASLRQTVTKFNRDAVQVNNWVQTQATQKELNGSNVPSAIKGPFTDFRNQAKTLAQYGKSHCGYTGPSVGSSGSSGKGSSGSSGSSDSGGGSSKGASGSGNT